MTPQGAQGFDCPPKSRFFWCDSQGNPVDFSLPGFSSLLHAADRILRSFLQVFTPIAQVRKLRPRKEKDLQ